MAAGSTTETKVRTGPSRCTRATRRSTGATLSSPVNVLITMAGAADSTPSTTSGAMLSPSNATSSG